MLPVDETTFESLQKMSTEDTGEFSIFQRLVVCTTVFPFACTGNESDKGVACKRKLFSGTVVPGLLGNVFTM